MSQPKKKILESSRCLWGKISPTGAKNVWLELPDGTIPARFDMAPFRYLTATSEPAPKPEKPDGNPILVDQHV